MACADPAVQRAADRERFKKRTAERVAAGCCTRCAAPVHDGLSRCAPCIAVDEAGRNPERKNAASRRRYHERKARGLCTDCGTPSPGASRCPPCAERSYHRSGHFRGIPVWDPAWTVVELETGREHGPFDSESDVALCLVFEKLDRDVHGRSPYPLIPLIP